MSLDPAVQTYIDDKHRALMIDVLGKLRAHDDALEAVRLAAAAAADAARAAKAAVESASTIARLELELRALEQQLADARAVSRAWFGRRW